MNGSDDLTSDDEATLTCWAIADGAAGHQSQVKGLAEAIEAEYEAFDCRVAFPWILLPTGLIPLKPKSFKTSHSLSAEPPQVVISCGRQAALGALALKQIHGEDLFAICLQNPKIKRDRFDLIIAPEHDQLSGANVVSTLGAMHHLSLKKLQTAASNGLVGGLEKLTARFVAVLLGGPNKYYAFDEADVKNLVQHLKSVIADDLQLAIIPSRRTPVAAIQELQKEFGEDHFVWNQQGENPYLPALALCSYCVVTSDSVSMISEATATGQPVYIEQLQEQKAAPKFQQFHTAMIERGYARSFEGAVEDWIYVPPQEAERVAKIVKERLAVGN
ncbi:mitochondrial fission ELM1 family protein [Planctomicrobium sp.]|jgi:uncharacterized protein|nr:mitochondrial fission ELM1 family protein [Planctomicrobium sp.]MBT5019246.1 hypothetical protein [Planctomicrobium sp.]MDA7527733.1 mitochondrial fission ELM1 family protein [bacterium]MDB4743955.1 mitochondrial fission ELM1 family protein [Planctomicrobium sp.]MDB4802377.1 mitochondrial fission ELM1 family protein [bacterium]